MGVRRFSEPRTPNPVAFLRVARAQRSEAPVFVTSDQPSRRPPAADSVTATPPPDHRSPITGSANAPGDPDASSENQPVASSS